MQDALTHTLPGKRLCLLNMRNNECGLQTTTYTLSPMQSHLPTCLYNWQGYLSGGDWPVPLDVSSLTDPPTYAESISGAVNIGDEDGDEGTMGDLMYTPMYTYVYDYRYRAPPAYCEVGGKQLFEGNAFG